VPQTVTAPPAVPPRPILRLLLALLFLIAAALGALDFSHLAAVPPVVRLGSRWLVVAAMIALGFRRRTLTTWILVAMVLGAELGHDFPHQAVELQLLSQIFLRMIRTIIAPLLFATLVVGIAGHPDLKQVGRMGIKALVYFEIVTTLALFIGLAAINLSQAGSGIHLPPASDAERVDVVRQAPSDVILHVFPENIAKSVAEGQILQVVVFAILFGCALALLPESKRRPLLAVVDSLAETMFKFTNIVMYFAPVGVGAAVAYTVGRMGLGILGNLLELLATLYAAIFAFILLVLLPVALMIRLPLRRFVSAIAEPVSLAFATTSSEAALPRAMEAMEAIGVPRRIVAFVMPTGYSFNLDGSSIYLSLAAIFVAQAAGVRMGAGQQLFLVFTLMLTSKGVAGVPRAALVVLLGTVTSFHLPTEPVFIILGVDALMDMGRTSLNVIGNCLATCVVARWEGELGTEMPSKVVQEALNG
jgi:proton glutamate symport protein